MPIFGPSALARALFALGLAIASQGCKSGGAARPAGTNEVCTPGESITCRCAGGPPATTTCADDGQSYLECPCSDASVVGDASDDEAAAPADAPGDGADVESGGDEPDVEDAAAPSDESPFGSSAPADAGATACGEVVGVYRGVPAFSNGATFAAHACDDAAACAGDSGVAIACGSASLDGCSGPATLRTPNGIAFESVELVRRYFATRYGASLACRGAALAYWRDPDPLFDVKIVLGASPSTPRVDDLVFFRHGAGDAVGHVAIVRGVSGTHVRVVQQNAAHDASDAAYPLEVSSDASGHTLLVDAAHAFDGWEILGLLRSTRLDPFACAGAGDCPDDLVCRAGRCETSASSCGDAIVDEDEQCDGASLGGQTCASIGFSGGALACSAACTFDTSRCCHAACVGKCGGAPDGCSGKCDGACPAGEACAAGACVACGHAGEPCCAADACVAPASCQGGTCN